MKDSSYLKIYYIKQSKHDITYRYVQSVAFQQVSDFVHQNCATRRLQTTPLRTWMKSRLGCSHSFVDIGLSKIASIFSSPITHEKTPYLCK